VKQTAGERDCVAQIDSPFDERSSLELQSPLGTILARISQSGQGQDKREDWKRPRVQEPEPEKSASLQQRSS
jgi:hypothetical protein